MSKKAKILIGYDGSACAEAALDDLQMAGLPRRGVEALVLSVAEVWLPPPPPSVYEVIESAQASQTPADLQRAYARRSPGVEEAETLALRAAERLRRNFPEWKVNSEATYGSPAWEIISKADQWEPDLVVVGSHGRSALGRFVLGSVSQKVITEARGSVRVARGRIEVDPSPVRIVIGVDGSPDAEAAVREVAGRVWPADSQALIITAVEPFHMYGVEPDLQTERVRALHEYAETTLRDAGLSASSIIREGNPKRILIDEAEKWDADSIFVGAKGHKFIERLLLGSVSAAVAARAACSVEVVRSTGSGK